MKVYIAGPMRGLPEFNFPAFFSAEEYLKEQGHEPFNPARRDSSKHGKDLSSSNATGSEVEAAVQHGFSLREALRDDTAWISMEAEAVAMLPGWPTSKGARAEKALAEALHLEVIYLPGAAPDLIQADPNGLDAHTPGAKLDQNKTPVFDGILQYFPRALLKVAALSAWGATRYTWEGWRSVSDGFRRYSNAMGRHILKEKTEGLYDLDVLNDPKYPANILHATQVAWNSLARLELLLVELEQK